MKAEGLSPSGLPGRSHGLFGRDGEIARLRQLLDTVTSESGLVLIEGDGGTGKTSLLKVFEADLRAANRPFLPSYDFYHIDNFRARVIEETITRALLASRPELQAAFQPYHEARSVLERSRITGSGFQAAQQAVREAFVVSYNRAIHRLDSPQRVVLLFDTVEQAVALSDGADQTLGIVETSPSAGGEHWLREILPRLEGTLTVFGGRTQTLYGHPVQLYAALATALPLHRELIGGLAFTATVALAHDMLAQALAPSSPDYDLARQIDLDDQAKLRTWHLVSGGLPFWVALLFTLEFVGQEDHSPLTVFQEKVAAAGPQPDPETLAGLEYEALIVRGHAFTSLAGKLTPNTEPLLIAIQCMASIRKGLTPELLASVLAALDVTVDVQMLFAQLAGLVIVKERTPQRYTSRGEQPNDQQDRELQLFLHDEMYAWLDTHPPVSNDLRGVVAETVVSWYEDVIATAEQARLEEVELLLTLPSSDEDAQAAQRARANDALRRHYQLERDLLGYTYEVGHDDRGRAAALLNLLTFESIFARDSGHGTALRQEALRHIARQPTGASHATELEFAAHWLLRAAVQNDDRETSAVLLARINERYRAALDHDNGVHIALLHLAIAIAQLYSGAGTSAVEHTAILATLDRAETTLALDTSPQLSAAERRWRLLLHARILNFRGYLYRISYAFAKALRAYRRSDRLAREDQTLAPQFRAITLRNLAFALSEDGEGDEAKRVGGDALKLHLRYGTAYDVALDRSTLARVEIRLGHASRALRYAEPAVETMRKLQGPRGLVMALTALAISYRKAAEQVDDSIAEQDELFARSLAVLAELERELQIQDPAEQLEAKQIVERWVILFQARGRVYRSWGLARRRRSLIPIQQERSRTDFEQAQQALEHALRVAHAHVPEQGLFDEVLNNPAVRQPKLVLADIHKDLAAVYVNADEYDERIYIHLRQAEALAREYWIIPGVGVPDLPDATHAFWRVLGQCELQRMLAAFGKFDFGHYTFNREDGIRTLQDAPGNEQFLDEAARHLVRMMAYLVKYNPAASMLRQARELTLRELLISRSREQLDIFDLAAYQATEELHLLHAESFKIVQDVIGLARQNLGYDES